MTALSIETRKKFFFLLAIFYLLYSGWQCYRDAQRSLEQGVFLNVRSRANTGLSVYNKHILADGHGFYTTGTQGQLYWRPRSLKEAALLNVLAGKGADLLSLAVLIIVFVAIFYTFKGSRDGAFFTRRMSMGLILILAFLTINESLLEVVQSMIGHRYLPYVTHNRFNGVIGYRSAPGGFILPFLMFLSIIPTKALEQQKEAELTI